MSYYMRPMGDYKTYGYGQGDPGFLSDIWKGIKRVAKPIVRAIFPIPTAVYEAARGRPPVPGQLPGPLGPGQFPTSFPGMGARGPADPRWWAARPPGTVAPLPPSMQPTGLPRGAKPFGPDGSCPCGYHPEKSGKGYCVRNRRMNVANPRALRRGMRRVSGFEKLARRTITFTRRVKIKKKAT